MWFYGHYRVFYLDTHVFITEMRHSSSTKGMNRVMFSFMFFVNIQHWLADNGNDKY